ncbi:hypothetical protein D3C87_1696330 [compost metagenome]
MRGITGDQADVLEGARLHGVAGIGAHFIVAFTPLFEYRVVNAVRATVVMTAVDAHALDVPERSLETR